MGGQFGGTERKKLISMRETIKLRYTRIGHDVRNFKRKTSERNRFGILRVVSHNFSPYPRAEFALLKSVSVFVM